MAVIIDYEDQYHKDFRQLNLEWLEKFNLLESHDLEILDHPKENVIDRGGFIFLLKEENNIVGTAGIFKINDKEYELIKMYVAPEYRGKKYGEMLLQHCVAKAQEMSASKIILYSNSQLQTAIRLYEKFGFIHVNVTDAPFVTADIKMEMVLSNNINDDNRESDTIYIEHEFAANKEKVWNAWTNPAIMKQWFGSDPNGKVLEANTDVRPNGFFKVAFANADGEQHTCSGKYKDVQTFEKLSFTWSWENEPGVESFVTVLLEPKNNNTLMKFEHAHVGFASAHNYLQGWNDTFLKLEKALPK